MVQTFQAQVKAFADRAEQKLEAVIKQSAQEVFETAQRPKAQGGRMPVNTGFLRNSLVASLDGGTVAGGTEAYTLAIAGMELGQTIFGGWTAEYALHQEYGTVYMPGNFYMLGAAQEWQSIVARNAEKVQTL